MKSGKHAKLGSLFLPEGQWVDSYSISLAEVQWRGYNGSFFKSIPDFRKM